MKHRLGMSLLAASSLSACSRACEEQCPEATPELQERTSEMERSQAASSPDPRTDRRGSSPTSGWPGAHDCSVLIAEHGSWNRSKKLGYRISQVSLDEKNHATAYRPFIEGWLHPAEDEVVERPTDREALDDGSLLVSDDFRWLSIGSRDTSESAIAAG